MKELIKKYKRIICVLVFTVGAVIIGMITGLIFIRPVFTSTAFYLVTDTSGYHNEIVHPDEIREFFRHDYFTDHLAEKTAGKFSGEEMRQMVKITASRTSPTFKVKVTCSNATDVYFIQKTIEAAPRLLAPELSDEYFLIISIEGAAFPEKPSRPGFRILILIFALLGAAGSSVFMVKKKELFTVSNTSETLIRYQIPVLARIPVYRKNGIASARQNSEYTKVFLKNSGIAVEKTRRADTSDYNPDRNTIMIGPQTGIDFFDAFRRFLGVVGKITDGSKAIVLITSPCIGDGKTTTALNLGITAAAEGKSVLLADCNFHNKRLMRAFNIDTSSPGLYDIVFGNMPVKEAILFTEYHSLFVLPQGNTEGTNPLTLLTRPETLNALRSMREMFDYIIIDSPPVNAFPDALRLSEISDLVFLTVRNSITHEEEIEKALKSLELSDISVTGFVLNEADSFSESSTPSSPGMQDISKNRFISGFGL